LRLIFRDPELNEGTWLMPLVEGPLLAERTPSRFGGNRS